MVYLTSDDPDPLDHFGGYGYFRHIGAFAQVIDHMQVSLEKPLVGLCGDGLHFAGDRPSLERVFLMGLARPYGSITFD
ncbi:hypothetical protein, partial [Adlercreutzia sp. ZJ304]|uniref:hypothetical protein n=1 Tax=Adlercreutzia sp. ZJ304 TaxID=2709791 RepID=UPI00197FC73D